MEASFDAQGFRGGTNYNSTTGIGEFHPWHPADLHIIRHPSPLGAANCV
jgi:hypothetical protein